MAINKLILGRALVLILFLCAVLVQVAAEVGAASVVWDQAHPITWYLFQGTPPADAGQRSEAAAIHMTIRWHAGYSISSTDGTNWVGQMTSITVTNTMEPALSWVVPGKTYERLLRHEQLHFDLNEVYRRKLEFRLLQQTGAFAATTQQEVIDLLNQSLHHNAEVVLQELAEMQALYDLETSHSNNHAEQARWDSLITGWLDSAVTTPLEPSLV